MADVGSLQEQALKRKERLKNLRKKQTQVEDNEDSLKRKADDSGEDEIKKPAFKNYKPEDESLQEHLVPQTEVPKVEEQVQDQLKAAVAEPVVEEVDITNLAPRKPDWDLKRDVAKKLEKLERRTQRAIAELIRERLQNSEENDIVSALTAHSEVSEKERATYDSDSD
ncbi:coiled-coil domain-containing protein 12-like [Lytechinus variegatus]|uniref:coiled-coil domain-containing protein 12-like n=1 Tax=Lytechinus variegatus TaxID=7654 RepID=UPI001BB25751|nr:coiled-coil domain-containing protein 12-like [Lytechinus variegatus]